MAKPSEVRRYYKVKAGEYVEKYGFSGVTHIHTGHYDPATEPELFRAGWIDPRLGVARLRYLMHRGQERTVDDLLMDAFRHGAPSNVLDCGAGHGGTSIRIAERHQVGVDALTISPQQARLIEDQARVLGVRNLVRPVVADIFGDRLPSETYDLVMGVDAFCQMGKPAVLFRTLRARQRRGGVLAVSDTFLERDDNMRRRFNDYWRSRITLVADTTNALTAAGYTIVSVNDTSRLQLPFWRLSIAYGDASPSTPRRQRSMTFHRDLVSGFTSGVLRYLRVVAVAS
jgi:SAM-dependent methyltransferase